MEKRVFSFLNRFGITAFLCLLLLIACKQNQKFKTLFHQKVLEKNLSFAQIGKWYENYFGSPMPFQSLLEGKVQPVFQEQLSYQDSSKYLEGVSLTVEKNYLVPVITKGMVVFKGEKEGYGKTVIISGEDGIEIWYGNLDEINVHLYDQVKEGSFLGNVIENKLYLVFKKGGKVEKYDEYLENKE